MIQLLSAPLQGYTEGIWRRAHADVYSPDNGAADCYFTPFVRVEKGSVRSRDIRDALIGMPGDEELAVQIIFKDLEEFRLVTDAVIESGARRIDLNMGCPFPPQVHKGRGAAMVARRELLAEVKREIDLRTECVFSLKMRLGVSDADEWRRSIDVVNAMRLSHVAVHPRTARQQYTGELDLLAFSQMYEDVEHPVVFNGEIHAPSDIDRLLMRFPELHGVMVGRGLLARPSLFAEWRDGEEWTEERKLHHILQMHKIIFTDYTSRLAGQAQILSKIKTFWEYLEPIIGHKTFKAIKKARTLDEYEKTCAGIAPGTCV